MKKVLKDNSGGLDFSDKPPIYSYGDDGTLIPHYYDPQLLKHVGSIQQHPENADAIEYAAEHQDIPKFLYDYIKGRLTNDEYTYLKSLMTPGFYSVEEIMGARQGLAMETVNIEQYPAMVHRNYPITSELPTRYKIEETYKFQPSWNEKRLNYNLL